MMYNAVSVKKPIGLHEAVHAIEELCANSVPFENSKVDPILIELEAGNGQTTFAKYAAQMVIQHKVRQVVGLTTYLEFTVSTREDQMQAIFGDIARAAKGVNQFESVILFDITALCDCIREKQTGYFLMRLQEITKHAVVILCISPSKAKSKAKLEELRDKLKASIDGLQTVEIEPYSDAELTQMVLAKLDDYGVDIVDVDVFTEKLKRVVADSTLTCAREIETIAEALVKQARVDRFSAVLDVCDLVRAFPNACERG